VPTRKTAAGESAGQLSWCETMALLSRSCHPFRETCFCVRILSFWISIPKHSWQRHSVTSSGRQCSVGRVSHQQPPGDPLPQLKLVPQRTHFFSRGHFVVCVDFVQVQDSVTGRQGCNPKNSVSLCGHLKNAIGFLKYRLH